MTLWRDSHDPRNVRQIGRRGRLAGLRPWPMVSRLPPEGTAGGGTGSAVTEARADAVWADVAAQLRAGLSETAYSAWFGSARPVTLDDEELRVEVPNEFTRGWIDGHFADLVARAARDAAGTDLRVAFAVAPEQPHADPREAEPVVAGAPAPAVAPPIVNAAPARYLPKYTFDSFVIGSSNRFAHAAALAVAEAPGQAYNPLVIYGGTGLGKTHLLQAIGAYVAQHAPDLRSRYVTSEAFTNEFIAALRDKRMEAFKQRYRAEHDLLLVDDVQFLGGRGRIQEEFSTPSTACTRPGGRSS